MGLSLTIDVFVLAAKGIPPTTFVSRLVVDAFLLGVRLTITAAVLASIVSIVPCLTPSQLGRAYVRTPVNTPQPSLSRAWTTRSMHSQRTGTHACTHVGSL